MSRVLTLIAMTFPLLALVPDVAKAQGPFGGGICAAPARTCALTSPAPVGTGCSCRIAGGRARGTVVGAATIVGALLLIAPSIEMTGTTTAPTFRFGRAAAYILINVYAIKMGGVFGSRARKRKVAVHERVHARAAAFKIAARRLGNDAPRVLGRKGGSLLRGFNRLVHHKITGVGCPARLSSLNVGARSRLLTNCPALSVGGLPRRACRARPELG
jgi:hypothetical protein